MIFSEVTYCRDSMLWE